MTTDKDIHGGERVYPCADCGTMRSKAEGGTVFTVCDECWDKHYKGASQTGDAVRSTETAGGRYSRRAR